MSFAHSLTTSPLRGPLMVDSLCYHLFRSARPISAQTVTIPALSNEGQMILILRTMTVFVARGFGPRDTAYEPFELEPRPCSSCATRSVFRSFLSSELFPFSESQGALVSCTVHLAFL